MLAAWDRKLDLLGEIVVAAITAIGGGTLRDLLLNRHPIFWVTDSWYLMVIIAAALLTVAYVRIRPAPGITLLVADTLGLALFALSGAQLAEVAHCSPLIVVLMGTVTGVTGGILRDVITAQIPIIAARDLRHGSNYGDCRLLGAVCVWVDPLLRLWGWHDRCGAAAASCDTLALAPAGLRATLASRF